MLRRRRLAAPLILSLATPFLVGLQSPASLSGEGGSGGGGGGAPPSPTQECEPWFEEDCDPMTTPAAATLQVHLVARAGLADDAVHVAIAYTTPEVEEVCTITEHDGDCGGGAGGGGSGGADSGASSGTGGNGGDTSSGSGGDSSASSSSSGGSGGTSSSGSGGASSSGSGGSGSASAGGSGSAGSTGSQGGSASGGSGSGQGGSSGAGESGGAGGSGSGQGGSSGAGESGGAGGSTGSGGGSGGSIDAGGSAGHGGSASGSAGVGGGAASGGSAGSGGGGGTDTSTSTTTGAGGSGGSGGTGGSGGGPAEEATCESLGAEPAEEPAAYSVPAGDDPLLHCVCPSHRRWDFSVDPPQCVDCGSLGETDTSFPVTLSQGEMVCCQGDYPDRDMRAVCDRSSDDGEGGNGGSGGDGASVEHDVADEVVALDPMLTTVDVAASPAVIDGPIPEEASDPWAPATWNDGPVLASIGHLDGEPNRWLHKSAPGAAAAPQPGDRVARPVSRSWVTVRPVGSGPGASLAQSPGTPQAQAQPQSPPTATANGMNGLAPSGQNGGEGQGGGGGASGGQLTCVGPTAPSGSPANDLRDETFEGACSLGATEGTSTTLTLQYMQDGEDTGVRFVSADCDSVEGGSASGEPVQICKLRLRKGTQTVHLQKTGAAAPAPAETPPTPPMHLQELDDDTFATAPVIALEGIQSGGATGTISDVLNGALAVETRMKFDLAFKNYAIFARPNGAAATSIPLGKAASACYPWRLPTAEEVDTYGAEIEKRLIAGKGNTADYCLPTADGSGDKDYPFAYAGKGPSVERANGVYGIGRGKATVQGCYTACLLPKTYAGIDTEKRLRALAHELETRDPNVGLEGDPLKPGTDAYRFNAIREKLVPGASLDDVQAFNRFLANMAVSFGPFQSSELYKFFYTEWHAGCYSGPKAKAPQLYKCLMAMAEPTNVNLTVERALLLHMFSRFNWEAKADEVFVKITNPSLWSTRGGRIAILDAADPQGLCAPSLYGNGFTDFFARWLCRNQSTISFIPVAGSVLHAFQHFDLAFHKGSVIQGVLGTLFLAGSVLDAGLVKSLWNVAAPKAQAIYARAAATWNGSKESLAVMARAAEAAAEVERGVPLVSRLIMEGGTTPAPTLASFRLQADAVFEGAQEVMTIQQLAGRLQQEGIPFTYVSADVGFGVEVFLEVTSVKGSPHLLSKTANSLRTRFNTAGEIGGEAGFRLLLGARKYGLDPAKGCFTRGARAVVLWPPGMLSQATLNHELGHGLLLSFAYEGRLSLYLGRVEGVTHLISSERLAKLPSIYRQGFSVDEIKQWQLSTLRRFDDALDAIRLRVSDPAAALTLTPTEHEAVWKLVNMVQARASFAETVYQAAGASKVHLVNDWKVIEEGRLVASFDRIPHAHMLSSPGPGLRAYPFTYETVALSSSRKVMEATGASVPATQELLAAAARQRLDLLESIALATRNADDAVALALYKLLDGQSGAITRNALKALRDQFSAASTKLQHHYVVDPTRIK